MSYIESSSVLPEKVRFIVSEGTTISSATRLSAFEQNDSNSNPLIQSSGFLEIAKDREVAVVAGEPLITSEDVLNKLRQKEGGLIVDVMDIVGLHIDGLSEIVKIRHELPTIHPNAQLLQKALHEMMRIDPQNLTNLRNLIIAQTTKAFERYQAKLGVIDVGTIVLVVGTMHFGLLEALLMSEEERLSLIRQNPNTLKLYNPATINQGYYVKSNRSGTARIGVPFPNPIIPERANPKRRKK